ncbi:MAG: DUF3276 family protein [Chitinophagales bacterium]
MDKQEGFYSRKLRAGKRRTYFFDVRSTKQGDYFVTITESKRRFDKPGYDSHKIFLYKEDFNKFAEALNDTIGHIKTELNPDFDYDSYDREAYYEQVEKAKEELDATAPKIEEDIVEDTVEPDQIEKVEMPKVEPTEPIENPTTEEGAMEW